MLPHHTHTHTHKVSSPKPLLASPKLLQQNFLSSSRSARARALFLLLARRKRKRAAFRTNGTSSSSAGVFFFFLPFWINSISCPAIPPVLAPTSLPSLPAFSPPPVSPGLRLLRAPFVHRVIPRSPLLPALVTAEFPQPIAGNSGRFPCWGALRAKPPRVTPPLPKQPGMTKRSASCCGDRGEKEKTRRRWQKSLDEREKNPRRGDHLSFIPIRRLGNNRSQSVLPSSLRMLFLLA